MTRYFKIAPAAYEAARAALDSTLGLVQPETAFMPADRGPKTADGRILLAVRDAHSEIPVVALAISGILSSTDGVEIDRQEYQSHRPTARL